jgi:hypothetical protein
MGAPGPKVRPVIDRFAERVALTDSGCIEWLGASTGDGYAQIKLSPSEGKRLVYVHRWSYQYHVGPIPEGLEIDHLCHNRACVNPDHLEAVTPRVNWLRSANPTSVNARKTRCIHGHPFAGKNLMVSADGKRRYCRECRRTAYRQKLLREGAA